jgi:hypothetical protein
MQANFNFSRYHFPILELCPLIGEDLSNQVSDVRLIGTPGHIDGLGLWCLTLLSTIFQLLQGGQFY